MAVEFAGIMGTTVRIVDTILRIIAYILRIRNRIIGGKFGIIWQPNH